MAVATTYITLVALQRTEVLLPTHSVVARHFTIEVRHEVHSSIGRVGFAATVT